MSECMENFLKLSSMEHQLTPIKDISELCQLRDLYFENWPEHCVGYYCLNNFIRWLQLEQDIPNLHFFTLNGDWKSDGLCLIVDRYQLFVNSLSNCDHKKLSIALSLLDWSIGYKISSVRQFYLEIIKSVVTAKHLKLDYCNETLMYYMPRQQALKLEINCPSGYIMRRLKECDASCIDNLWGNKHKGSLFLIKRLISWNINTGICSLENDELVAWCLRLQGGFLGALQVKTTHKGLGLGGLAAAFTAKCIAESGDDVMALVYDINHAARTMFEKLGFTIVNKCYWLRPFPTIPDYEWPDSI